MVFGAVFNCELEEMLEFKNTVTDKTGVVSLANGGDTDSIHGDPEHGVLGCGELLVVGQFVEPVTQTSTLLHPQLVEDWPHEALVPLDESPPVAEPVRQVEETLSSGSGNEGVLDDEFNENFVESRLSIEQQNEDGLLRSIETKLDYFREEESRKFMGGSCSLELCLSLGRGPARFIQAAHVLVESFGEERTGGDGPV